MKKGCLGSSLTQYIIIIAVILAAIIPIFFMVGGNLTSIFSGYSSLFGDMAVKSQQNLKSQQLHDITNGDLSVQCEDDKCDFKLGDIVIEGVPDDFISIVETSGSGAATDALVDILDQVAKSMEDAGLAENADEIKQLAAMGHNIAQIEKQLSEYDCTFSTNMCTSLVNPELVSMDNEFKSSLLAFDSHLAQVLSSMEDNKDLKALIEQPSAEILGLGNTFSSIVDENKKGDIYKWQTVLAHYNNISTVTDIDSAIICAAGQGDDNGYTCE